MFRRERFFVGAVLVLTVAKMVVAFVHHASIGNRRPSPYLLHAGDDLKGLLDSSSYESDVVKAYAGKTIKTAKKVKAGTYDLSVDTASLPESPAPVPVEDVQSTTTSAIVDTAPPPPPPPAVVVDPSPPPVETIETVTKTVKETVPSGDSVASPSNPLEGLSVPTDVQETMQKPFAALNSLLKDTQNSIEQTKAAAAARTAEQAARAASSTSNPDGKVPTLGEYFTQTITVQRRAANLDSASVEKASVDIKLPSVDVRLPDNVKLPEVKLPMDQVVKMTGDVALPEPGKALPFGEYLRAKAAGVLPESGDTTSTVANIKAKLGIMAANYYKLIGEDVPESLTFHNIKIDLSNLSNQMGAFDYQKALGDLPQEAPWAAVALGAFFVVAGARNQRPEESKLESKAMKAASAAIGGLTEDLESLQSRMKVLEETGLSLQAELKAAKDKLLQKELEISKEKLKVADNQLTLNREIQRLEQKLKENTVQVKSLDKELVKTLDESEEVKKQLEETVKQEVVETKVVEELPPAEEEPAPVVEELPPAEEEPAPAVEELPPAEEEPALAPAPKKAAVKKAATKKKTTTAVVEATEAPAPAPAPKKAAPKATTVKTAKPKKAAATKQKGSTAVKEEPPVAFFADEVPAPAPAPKKKAAAKKKAAPKASAMAAAGAAKDMSDLSKSTLAKKTVKELTEFLDSKGVTTTDNDGKPLKKADLIEAVLSL